MEAILFALAAAAGASALWWQQARRQRQLAAGPLDDVRYATDADIALHVARHEAQGRGHDPTSLHILYGLLQDEAIADAITAAGGDARALEERVVGALERSSGDPEDLARVLARAAYSAAAGEREVTARDLWAYLAGTRADAELAAGKVRHVAVLFRLCHGADPVLTGYDGGEVFVVLRNDDYTTRDFVCEVLAQVFSFTARDADARMMETHTAGRAIVGRFAADEARAKIARIRELASERGFPLWIGVEPT